MDHLCAAIMTNRSLAIPLGVPYIWFFESDAVLKSHAAYVDAKGGDGDAALRLIFDLALSAIIEHRHLFDQSCIFVAPFAREASGDNAIPQILAELCAAIYGASADQDVVQVTKVYHTGADPMERLALRPLFEGDVQPGRSYVLVDDVISLGGTLAELANYIQSKGGLVKGVLVLVNAARSKAIRPAKQHLKLLKERFPHDIEDIFGIEVDALTANEAGYLVGFRTADAIRNRLVKAEEEITLRLRSKGITGPFG